MGVEPRSVREELSGPRARITTTPLQHHPDPRAKPPSVGNGIGPEHPHRAGVGAPKALTDLDSGGLASTVRAEDSRHRPALDRQRQPVRCGGPAIPLYEVAHLAGWPCEQ